jgi:outer membrane protein OmpA-like peptidoglycan-associated protein
MKNKMYVRQSVLVAGVCGLLASVAVVGAPATQVSASTPTNGPLHYSIGAGTSQKSFSSDGTSVTLPSFLTGAPFYSADGTKVAWVKITMGPGTETSDVYVANADGSDQKKLLTASGGLNKPQFSADKSKIFVVNNPRNEIYSIDATTENQTLGPAVIAPSGGLRDFSVSSADKIAFIQYDNTKCVTFSFFVSVSNLDGAEETDVPGTCVADLLASAVQWNADGTRIFIAHTDTSTGSSTYRITSRDLSGNPVEITTLSAPSAGLALSPDGTKIAYATMVYGNGPDEDVMSLYTRNIDGTGVGTVVTNSDPIRALSWGIPVASSGDSATTTVPTTTVPTTTVPTTTVPTSSEAPSVVVPGVTVTDTKVYTRAPKRVTASSAITVLTPLQVKTRKIESNTPSVCLSTNDDIVFINEGRCSVSILSKKTGRVLKRLRTRVIQDEVSNLQVGNKVAVIAPIYFDGASNNVNARGLRRIRSLAPRITAAGTVLVVGHSGIALGDTPENRALSRQRAVATVSAIKKAGGKGPFNILGVGGKSPLVASTKGEDQAKNRRVVIVLVP